MCTLESEKQIAIQIPILKLCLHFGNYFSSCIVSHLLAKSNVGGEQMSKIKKDHSKASLRSSQVEGQGTTTHETGSIQVPSSNKKQKRS